MPISLGSVPLTSLRRKCLSGEWKLYIDVHNDKMQKMVSYNCWLSDEKYMEIPA
jgi:hypothetical protein